jgi:ribokinase
VAQILVFDDGDNSIAVAPGAGTGLGEAQVHGARATIAGARVVIASNEVPQAATLAAFRIARAAGVTTLLNPAPAAELPDALLALTDLLTPNESELRSLAQLPADAPLEQGAQRLLACGVGAVLATLGAEGCCLWRPGVAPLAITGWRMEAVVDTIGAGDTFNGALAAALARGLSLEQAMQRANAAAALSVTGQGAIGGMPTAAQVGALLATRG